MKKVFLLSAVAMFFLVSCQPEDIEPNQNGNEEPNQNEDVLLKELTTITNGSSSTAHFEYDGHKFISKTDDVKSFTYEYTGNLITKRTFQAFDHPDHKYEQYYQYNSNDDISQMIQLWYYGPNSPRGEKYVYTYNSNNTISYEKYEGSLDEQNTLAGQGTYYLDSENEVYKFEQKDINGNIILSVTHNFDQKKSPYKNITGYNKLFHLNGEENSNNLLSTEMVSANNTVSTFFEYEYNDDDYPVNLEYTITSDSEEQGEVITNYVYY